LEQQQSQQQDDLQQFQGARTPAAEASLEQQEDLKRRQDQADEQSGLVVFITAQDGSRQLKGGSKEKLVEKLTAGSNMGTKHAPFRHPRLFLTIFFCFSSFFFSFCADLQYMQAFLLTYRAFMAPEELFNLIARTWDSLEKEDQTKALPGRLRIINTLKYWMEKFWFDFSEDKALLQRLQTLVNNTMSSQAKLQKQLTRVLERKLSGQDAEAMEKRVVPAPKPIYEKKKLLQQTLIRKGSTPDALKLSRSPSTVKSPAGSSLDLRPKSLSVANLERVPPFFSFFLLLFFSF